MEITVVVFDVWFILDCNIFVPQFISFKCILLQEEDTVDGENSHPRSLTRSIATITHHSIMYAPKCLVLVSRLDYIETFRVNKLYLITVLV
jgi:hypothetical protein